MEPFAAVEGTAAPLGRDNVDTDQIIPKQFLKLVQRTGFGEFLFYDWRRAGGFVLDDPRYAGAPILVAGENFGCGSSREHAVWALRDAGFAVVIAPSFADIFYSNCLKNGVLPVRLGAGDVSRLLSETGPVRVDLEAQQVAARSWSAGFEIDPHAKRALLEGLDEIAQTLELEAEITAYEAGPRAPSPL